MFYCCPPRIAVLIGGEQGWYSGTIDRNCGAGFDSRLMATCGSLYSDEEERSLITSVVLQMSRICFVGIDRDAMRFQALGDTLDWLADRHVHCITSI